MDLVKHTLKAPYLLKSVQMGFNHILIAGFGQYAAKEAYMISRLANMAAALAPIAIRMQSLQFIHPHSILLPVMSSAYLQALLQEVKQHQWMMRMPMQRPYFVSLPHISLLHHLGIRQFEAIWQRISHRRFTAAFTANHLCILRRKKGEKKWQLIEKLAFENTLVSAHQGVLFD